MRTRERSKTSLFRYSPLVAALACALAAQEAPAAAYTVVNTNATGAGSLADAVAQANAGCFSDPVQTINFAIPGTGPFVISPSGSLNFSCSAQATGFTVDGSSQAGYQANTNPNGFNAAGVMIVIDGATIGGSSVLHVDAFPYGNSLTLIGLEVRNYNYAYGGAAISGNLVMRGNHVHSNRFGLDPHGFSAGIRSSIGTSALANRNVIRNNSITGIDISYGGFVDITNNLIGLDPTGTTASPNNEGIVVEAGQDVTISGNYISGNSGRGVRVTTTTSAPSVSISNNKIGMTPAGAALGNGTHGVRIESSNNVQILNNVIANSGQNGVLFADVSGPSSGVLIAQNSIHSNAAKNIDLDFAGSPLPNDNLDVDTGPNGRQNHPIITGVTQGGGNTSVSWTLNSAAGQAYRVEFFSNAAPGTPAGLNFLVSSGFQTTDTGGNTGGTQVISGTFNNISATAIAATNNDTSEFSTAVALTPTPAVTIAPNPLTFANTVVGSSSGPTAITVTSTGTANYIINTFDSAPSCYGGPICATGAFSCSNTCTTGGTGYATNASCNINVTFTPSTLGPQSTTFYLCDNAPGSPHSVTVSGTAVTPPPATLTPNNFNFGSVAVGGLSSFQSFTVTNGAPTPLAIGPFTTTGQFQVVAGSCGATLPANSSCTVDGRFAPTTAGAATGTIDVGTASGALSANVSGNGTAPPPTTVSPVSFDFGSRQVGTTSSTAFFTFTNPSLVPVSLTPVTTSGPFALVSSSCGATLAPNSSCSASANFQPVAVGAASGSIQTVANGNTLASSLAGNGTPIPPPPSVTVTPLNTNFGNVTVGASSAMLTFTIANPSPTVAATLGTLSTTGPYVINTNTCGATLAPSSSCNAGLVFQPAAAGAAPGTFVVPASTGTVTANLSGTGVSATALTISPPGYDFGPILVGTSSNTRTFTISNPNPAQVPITALAATGPFSITLTSCGASINPSASCEANVRFTPVASGTVSGSLVVDTTGTFTAAGKATNKSTGFGTSTAILTGTGLLQSSLDIPTSIDLGSGTLGGAAVMRIVPVSNSGNAALTIESISIAPPFKLVHDCPLNLLPGKSCNVTIELPTTALGDFTGALVVLSNSAGGSRSIPVRAKVQARPEPVLKVSPQSIGFGDRMAGTQAPAQRITITNEGGGDAIGVNLGMNTPHFQVQNTTCGQTLAAQSTCFADVAFTPLGFGPRRDTFNVRSSNGNPVATNLSGAGCRPITITASRGGQQLSCAP